MSLTIFITVFLFSSLIIFLTMQAFKSQAELVSGYISNSLAKNMNSDFFHNQAEFQEVNITDGIKSVLILTSNLWRNKIKIHEDFGDIPIVKCFPGLLNQVFMNVLVNAIQAVKDKGDIYIKTFVDDEYLNISIKDTGIGISEDYIPRIFEAGFSTKETGVGAGLGLSICFNIIQKHNGIIDVISSPGNGSEFIIKIPLKL